MKEPYYIEVFGKYGEALNAKNLIPLPTDTSYGNLLLKIVNLANTVDFINHKSEYIYKTFKKVRTETTDPIELLKNSTNIHLLSREIETVVYFTRRSIDELISLIYVLENDYPPKIKVDDIWKLLNYKKEKSKLGFLKEKYSEFLLRLNNSSNAYKHSFLNNEAYLLMGRDEPCVLVLGLKGNNLENGYEFDSISLKEILSSFESFLVDSLGILKEYSNSKEES